MDERFLATQHSPSAFEKRSAGRQAPPTYNRIVTAYMVAGWNSSIGSLPFDEGKFLRRDAPCDIVDVQAVESMRRPSSAHPLVVRTLRRQARGPKKCSAPESPQRAACLRCGPLRVTACGSDWRLWGGEIRKVAVSSGSSPGLRRSVPFDGSPTRSRPWERCPDKNASHPLGV